MWLARVGYKLGDLKSLPTILREDKLDLSHLALGQSVHAAVVGTISIIRQAVRYGIHYGVDALMVTDYERAVIFRDFDSKTVNWDFVERDDVCVALATTFWIGCQALRRAMDAARAQKKAGAAK